MAIGRHQKLSFLNPMETSTQIDNILQAISVLDLEDQLFVVEILNKRIIELRRSQIVLRAKDAEKNYTLGNVQVGTIEDLMMSSSDD